MSRPDRSFKKFDASLHVSVKLLLEKGCPMKVVFLVLSIIRWQINQLPPIKLLTNLLATILLHVKYYYESVANSIWILFDDLWILFTQNLRVSRECALNFFMHKLTCVVF